LNSTRPVSLIILGAILAVAQLIEFAPIVLRVVFQWCVDLGRPH
jgi:hypothetical protein